MNCATVFLSPKSSSSSSYKVYTALLTQSGGDDPQSIDSGAVTKGITYMVDGTSSDADFSNVGGPKYDGVTPINGTYFVAINNDVPNNYSDGQLIYNTGAPVVTVLENTIGNIWFTYQDVGVYQINSNGLFILNKSMVNISSTARNAGDNAKLCSWLTDDSTINDILIQTQDADSDDILYNTPIEIRVYN
jgi:hypothetical protein